MLSEGPRDRGVLSLPRRRAGALYPKLRPGPHSVVGESVASNQRARLYGAMVELAATRGYDASTVAELCALAGVSKRTLYDRFPAGKQQCFLATYDILVHRAETHILAAARCGPDPIAPSGLPQRLHALLDAFAHEVAAYPNAARLVLVEAPDAGPGALTHTVRTRRRVERMISWSLREGADAPAPSPSTVKVIVVDGARLVRARLRDGATAELAVELSNLCAATAAPPATTADGRRQGRSPARPGGHSQR
jgi:AcrR family transcriptional regulator